jgi:hypothetical protein
MKCKEAILVRKTIWLCIAVLATTWLCVGAPALLAQDATPAPTPGDVQPLPPVEPSDPTLPPTDPGTTPVPTDPGTTPTTPAPATSFEHTVTTPHGQHTQTWERTVTDDGYTYRRQQTWTNPDGTPVRSHETTFTGTDPYNFQREKTVTLRDGRTVEHGYSQSWDGTTLQRERTFSGPNGQTHNFQQTWTAGSGEVPPTDPTVAPAAQPTSPEQPAPVAETAPESTVPTAPKSGESLLQKLNPFGSKTTTTEGSKPAMSRPSGFTLGSTARGAPNPGNRYGLTRRQAGEPETATHRQQVQQRVEQIQSQRQVERPTSPRSNPVHTR